MRRFIGVLAVISVIIFAMRPALADGEELVAAGAKVDSKKVDAAVKKAVDYLKGMQQANSYFIGRSQLERMYPYGTTAFVLFALIKGGIDHDDPVLKKGFELLRSKEFPCVYSVSALILALAALYEPPEEETSRETEEGEGKGMRTTAYEPREKQAKKNFKKAPKWQQEWLRKAVNWLISKQAQNTWRYPGNSPGEPGHRTMRDSGNPEVEDNSNSQYAMLALHAADRLGISAPAETYLKVAAYFVLMQENDGPEVESFRVPAADLSLKKMKEMEKDMLKKLRKRDDEIEKAKKRGEKDFKPQTTLEPEDPYEKFGVELAKMHARGWCYIGKPDNSKIERKATGSMTTSGVASLAICKAKIEKTSWFKKHGEKVNQAMRDGMGWLLHKWTVQKNPNLDVWHYYYLYGLERCGVLTLTSQIGKHLWYEEGANYLLSSQSANGSWQGERSAMIGLVSYGPVWNTCFAILFLKKATAPIVRMPKEIYTGEELLRGRKKKEEEK